MGRHPRDRVGLPRFRRIVGARLRTADEGADTIVWLAASEAGVRTTGRFWLDRRPRSTEHLPGTKVTPSDAERLWEECVRLTGEAQAADEARELAGGIRE